MKKYFMATTAAGAVMALSAPVQADSYVTVFGGLSKLDNQSATLFTDSGGFISGTTSYFDNGGTTFQVGGSPASTVSDTALVQMKYTRVAWTKWTSDFIAYNTTVSADYDFDTGFVIGAAYGWELSNSPISVELEFAWRKHDGQADVFYNYSWTRTGVSTIWQATKYVSWTSVIHAVTGPYTGTLITKLPIGAGGGAGYVTKSNPFTSTKGSSTTETFTGDIRSWAIMANAWYDFNPGGTWHPYVGGGVGYADVEFEAGPVSASDSGLAYQFAAGLGFDINPTTRINAEYRYFSVPDIELTYMGEDLGLEYDLSEFIVGFKFSF